MSVALASARTEFRLRCYSFSVTGEGRNFDVEDWFGDENLRWRRLHRRRAPRNRYGSGHDNLLARSSTAMTKVRMLQGGPLAHRTDTAGAHAFACARLHRHSGAPGAGAAMTGRDCQCRCAASPAWRRGWCYARGGDAPMCQAGSRARGVAD
jgi:hypothetical protein